MKHVDATGEFIPVVFGWERLKRMDIIRAISAVPRVLNSAKDLVAQILLLHDNPKFQALVQIDPEIKAASDAISKDARTIQEAFK